MTTKHFSISFFLLLSLLFASCSGVGDETPQGGSTRQPVIIPDPPTPIILVSAGIYHTCSVFEDGRMKCWGDNGHGQLGQGDTNNRGDQEDEMGENLPDINLGTNGVVKSVGIGGGHTCTLLEEGSIKCWGRNNHGQLGQEDTDNRGDGEDEMGENLLSVNLGEGKTAKDVAAGENYTCALLNDDTVKCWGRNHSGQLGQENTDDLGDEENEMGALEPIGLGADKTAKAIAAGHNHVCAILNDDTLKCWGENGNGQLGQENTNNLGDGASEMGDNLATIDLGTGKTAKALSLGEGHTCALLNDDTVKCWGNNEYGQLGLGDTNIRGDESDEMGDDLTAIDLGTNRSARAITSGRNHSCALLNNNTIKCWGNNVFGRLGIGDTNHRGDDANEMGDDLLSVNLGSNKTIVNITAGLNYTCVLLEDNTIKCWGQNGSGRLGLGDASNRGDGSDEMGHNLPSVDLGEVSGYPLNSVFKLPTVSIGDEHVCALLDRKRVKCWGRNDHGQLGLEHTDDLGDNPNEMGKNLPDVKLGAGRSAKAVANGGHHTCALLDNNTIKCWGRNTNGQLGLGDTDNRGDGENEMGEDLPIVDLGKGRTAKIITAGNQHTCVLLDNNSIKCWGANTFGQLGLGDTNDRGDDPSEMGDDLPTVDFGSGTVQMMSSRGHHTCILLNDNTAKCWGHNGNGRLGLGDTNNRGDNANEMGTDLPTISLGSSRSARAIAVGNSHTCALLGDKRVKCWGTNNHGQLGRDNTSDIGDDASEMGDNLGNINIGANKTAKSIVAGDGHTCVILDDDSIKCWGRNNSGQLGIESNVNEGDDSGEMGDLSSISLGTGRTVKSVFAGGQNSCALLDDYSLKCWGNGDDGRLGDGNEDNQGSAANQMGDDLSTIDFGERDIKTGGNHTCSILGNGRVKCWGSNSYGELGLGDTDHRGDGEDEMGKNLPFVNLGISSTAKSLAIGQNHSCVILNDNSVKCWGRNDFGQLGLGDNSHTGDGANEMGYYLPTVNLGNGRTARSIYAGNDHSCALLDNSSVKCWGANSSGQLGQGDTNHVGDVDSEMGDSLPPINLGRNKTAKSLGVGGNHTCALLNDNSIKCWGNNDEGQLGLGDTDNRGDDTREMGDRLSALDLGKNRTAKAVGVGANHTCALLDDDSIKCWGGNTHGQLGLENTDAQGNEANEMGDSLSAVDLDTGRTGQMIAIGGDHSCALLDNNTLKCWGKNEYGQLGLENADNQGDNTNEMGSNLSVIDLGTRRNARKMTTGENHSCTLLTNNSIKCWGYNNRGQLGLESTDNQGDGNDEMGDNLVTIKL